jgi:hypothetical protein
MFSIFVTVVVDFKTLKYHMQVSRNETKNIRIPTSPNRIADYREQNDNTTQ